MEFSQQRRPRGICVVCVRCSGLPKSIKTLGFRRILRPYILLAQPLWLESEWFSLRGSDLIFSWLPEPERSDVVPACFPGPEKDEMCGSKSLISFDSVYLPISKKHKRAPRERNERNRDPFPGNQAQFRGLEETQRSFRDHSITSLTF